MNEKTIKRMSKLVQIIDGYGHFREHQDGWKALRELEALLRCAELSGESGFVPSNSIVARHEVSDILAAVKEVDRKVEKLSSSAGTFSRAGDPGMCFTARMFETFADVIDCSEYSEPRDLGAVERAAKNLANSHRRLQEKVDDLERERSDDKVSPDADWYFRDCDDMLYCRRALAGSKQLVFFIGKDRYESCYFSSDLSETVAGTRKLTLEEALEKLNGDPKSLKKAMALAGLPPGVVLSRGKKWRPIGDHEVLEDGDRITHFSDPPGPSFPHSVRVGASIGASLESITGSGPRAFAWRSLPETAWRPPVGKGGGYKYPPGTKIEWYTVGVSNTRSSEFGYIESNDWMIWEKSQHTKLGAPSYFDDQIHRVIGFDSSLIKDGSK